MPKYVRCLATVASVVCVLSVFAFAEDDETAKKPKHTIKEVMKKGLKGPLLKKVKSGKATDKEKLELLDMFISLVESKPPKGDEASWQKLSGGAALAAAKVAVGREGAVKELGKATNCGACHKPHKPPSK